MHVFECIEWVVLYTIVDNVCYISFVASLTIIKFMPVKINISGDGLSFEKETDMHRAGQIIAFLSSDLAVDTSVGREYPSSPVAVLGLGEARRKSPRQALSESDAKTNAEKIVILANFIRIQKGVESFSPKEIQVEFKRAGESLPKNLTRDFMTAVTQGYILENEEGDYSLTDLGLEVVADGFASSQNSAKKGSTKKRKGVAKGKKANAVRDEIINLEITPQLPGYPDYWSYTVKGSRILWLLAFASENNLADGLTSNEIECLASKLKDQIKPSAFTSLTESNIKKGYMTNPKGYAKILKIGEDFLKAQKQ